jgi:hypothetical protein
MTSTFRREWTHGMSPFRKLILTFLAAVCSLCLWTPNAQAQRPNFELDCPAGTTPVSGPSSATFNPTTGKFRQQTCINSTGQFVFTEAILSNSFPAGQTPNTGAIYAADALFGVKADAKVACSAAFTNLSNTVTTDTTLDPPFTSADVGSIVFGTNGACQGSYGSGQGTVLVPSGTITAFNGAHSITVSIDATGTCTSAGAILCTLVWGKTDNTVALQAAMNAAMVVGDCRTLVLPSGKMLISAPIFNITLQCGFVNAGNGRANEGFGVRGQGMGNTWIIPLPSFDGTNCTNGCIFGNVAQANFFQDFSIFGGGNATITNVGANPILNSNRFLATISNVGIFSWGNAGSSAGLRAVGVSGGPTYISNVQIYNGGGNCVTLTNSVATFGLQCFNLSGSAINPQGQYVYTSGSTFSTGANGALGVITAGTGTWISSGDTIITSNRVAIQGNITIRLIGDEIQNTQAGASFPTISMSNGAGAILHVSNTKITNTAGGDWLGAGAAGSQLWDDGGNLFSGTITPTNITFFGTGSISGTAQTAGNIALTSGWGTSTVGTVSGNTKAQRWIVTAAGVPAAGPVITNTFPKAFLNGMVPLCTLQQEGGTFGVLTNPVITTTNTTATITFTGTPVAAQTYTFVLHCDNP